MIVTSSSLALATASKGVAVARAFPKGLDRLEELRSSAACDLDMVEEPERLAMGPLHFPELRLRADLRRRTEQE
jgi:hypothetical protein